LAKRGTLEASGVRGAILPGPTGAHCQENPNQGAKVPAFILTQHLLLRKNKLVFSDGHPDGRRTLFKNGAAPASYRFELTPLEKQDNRQVRGLGYSKTTFFFLRKVMDLMFAVFLARAACKKHLRVAMAPLRKLSRINIGGGRKIRTYLLKTTRRRPRPTYPGRKERPSGARPVRKQSYNLNRGRSDRPSSSPFGRLASFETCLEAYPGTNFGFGFRMGQQFHISVGGHRRIVVSCRPKSVTLKSVERFPGRDCGLVDCGQRR